MKTNLIILGCAAAALAAPARAAVQVFDVSADPAGWQQALEKAGMVPEKSTDFGLDPDYGIISFTGPLTSEGAGPVSPGIVAKGWSIDTPIYAFNNLDGVGPSAGLGNPKNAVIAGYFVDSLQIDFEGTTKTAFEVSVLSFLGGPGVDVTVTTNLGETVIPGLAAPHETHTWGFLLDNPNEWIEGINIFDAGPVHGAEGFTMAMSYGTPEPATVLLLGIGVLAAYRRR